MEYKIFEKVRSKLSLPFILRVILGITSISIGVVFSLVPFIPGFVFVIFGLIMFIPVRKLKNIIKIRKGFIYWIKNISCKKTLKYKFYDILKHIKGFFKKK